MPSTKSNNSVKPKSSRKRRQPLNYNPKSSKKRTVASRIHSEYEVDSDFAEVEIKDNTRQKNEEQESSEPSDDDEKSNDVNKTKQDAQLDMDENRTQKTFPRMISPDISQRNSSSEMPSTLAAPRCVRISPELPVKGGYSLENENGFLIQSDKTFLQQQIQLLETSFSLQDCPSLLDKQVKRKNCVPHDVIEAALRKLNHKMKDEIQKHLNRQRQRQVLSELFEVEKDRTGYESQEEQRDEHLVETMSVSEILEKCSEEIEKNRGIDRKLLRRYSNTVAELRTLNDELKRSKQKIASCESNKLMVLEVECLAREATQTSIQKELERSNKLVNEVIRVLGRKS